MVLRTTPEEDDWHSVSDAKKRKQIQDRLAQRARRKRLRVVKDTVAIPQRLLISSSRRSDSDTSPSDHGPDVSDTEVMLERSDGVLDLSGGTASNNWNTIEVNDLDHLSKFDPTTRDAGLAHPDLLPNNLHIPIPSLSSTQINLPLTVFTALFLNGQILSITCSTTMASKSPPHKASTPVSLRPTISQLTTVHFQWIDRLPFPKLRDSLIKLQCVVDLDEFLNDIFVMPSFVIKRGAESWDPRAWSMEGVWAKKWAWLFF